jgi:hypothetical protein
MSPISLLAAIGKPHLVEGGAKLAVLSQKIVDHLEDLAPRFAIGYGAIKPLHIAASAVRDSEFTILAIAHQTPSCLAMLICAAS